MRLLELVERLNALLPEARDRDIACIAMLLCDLHADGVGLESREDLKRVVDKIQIRIQAANDQHMAVAEELDRLASNEPCEFDPKQIWTLIRAIKVQSQLIDLYSGESVLAPQR